MSQENTLCDLLAARRGIVCAVGAGGKKSVLRAIAAEHPGRVAITGTVPFLPPPETLLADRFSAEVDLLGEQLAAPGAHRIVVYGRPAEKKGRWGGVPPGLITDWHARFGFDTTLVKADGARMRWIKAPAEDEPVLPPHCDTLIPVMSARALGEPLSERIAHRLPLLERIAGCRAGEIFGVEHAARLLASERGLLKSAGNSLVRPVINMVDNEEQQELAMQTAKLALEMTNRFPHVLLMRLKSATEIVAVVARKPDAP